ncbi:hypothetical protein [uncultured Ruegeria sp.]|uniref:hypothetical protein n=1 Tax=uncultured Ruegeria sp. TaxID=259304 RepID=UPI0026378054|nr:hypothetical protein [uncultured Ruegeria sp.]
MKLATTVLSALTIGVLTACTDFSSEPPLVQFQGAPVEFPIIFMEYHGVIHHGLSTVCKYEMGKQRGEFTVPEVVKFEFTDKQQTLVLNCTVDEVIPIVKNRSGIKAFHWEGSWTWSTETTFRRKTSYRATGPVGDSRYLRVPDVEALSKLRETLIETRGVQILPYQIIVAPAKRSVKKTIIR